MNYAVILSGGIGTRMHMGDFPKQYYKVKDRMILEYTLDAFEKSESVDEIIIAGLGGHTIKSILADDEQKSIIVSQPC